MRNELLEPGGFARVDVYPTSIPRIQRNPLGYMQQMFSAHGDLIYVPLKFWDVVLVNHPAAIRHVLQTNYRNYSKDTIQYNTLSLVTGRGLLTSDGEEWFGQRRLLQPAFHRRRVQTLGTLITGATGRMLERWSAAAAAGDVVDVDEEIMTLTLEIVGRILFSMDLSDSSSHLNRAVLTLLDYVVYRAQHFIAVPRQIPTPRNRAVRSAMTTLDRFIFSTVAARRGGQAVGPGAPDLLDMLLAAEDPDNGVTMSAEQIRDQLVTLLIAGYETVASALIWTFYLLGRHAPVREAVQAEVDAVLGGRLPTAADVPALTYTRAVFDEVLRLYPPAWLITRRALAADQIGELQVPAGALVIMSPYAVHRHAAFWPDPEAFCPRRFLPQQDSRPERFAYIPFGGGPRLCIGDTLALFEATLITATISQRLELLPLDVQVPVAEPLVTLRPRHGLHMRPRARGGG